MANKKFKTGVDLQSTVKISSATAERAMVIDASGNLISSATTDTQIGYLSTATSDVQTQLGTKLDSASSVEDLSDVSDAGSGIIISGAERTKLDGIESAATADQSGAEIKAAYEAEADTNAYDDAAVAKLAAIEASATADQSGAEIKVAYEAEADTNAYDDAAVSKLAAIEASADVTDAANVAAAGATMDADTSLAGNGYFLDEDNMASDDATKVPSQQSVKAYVASEIASAVSSAKSYQGGYDAATDSPSLDDGSPIAGILKGDAYDVTVAGTFFSEDVEVGDMITAKQDSPTLRAHWVIVQANLTPASIKTQYESNADTNAYDDAAVSKLAAIEASATADQSGAEIKVAYEAEADTNAYDDAAVSKLAAIEASATADQSGAEIKVAYEAEADTNAYDDAAVSKLGGIEALADVTDATNVASAGATMDSDSSLAGNSYFLDEDNMASDDATKVPSQQSVKAYVDSQAAAGGNLSSGDIKETSFSAANNQAAAASVTGLAFANGTVRAFDAMVSVAIDATGDLFESFKLHGIQKGAGWDMSVESVGDESNIVFSITSAGQVQYTSGNEAGFVASAFRFRADTTSIA